MIIEIVGIDGSGKTSLANYIVENITLENEGFVFLNPFEKRECIDEIEQVANQFNKTKYELFSDRLINYLWIDDLLNNYINIILPIIQSNKSIIFDRYLLSARIYSKLTTNYSMDMIYDYLDKHLPRPNVYIFLNLPVEIALQRIYQRGKPLAFYESKQYLNKINIYYNNYFKNKESIINEKIIYLDASKPIDKIGKEAIENIIKLLNKKQETQ